MSAPQLRSFRCCVFLALLLGWVPKAAFSQTSFPDELSLRRQEAALLHRKIQFAGLRVLKKDTFVEAQVSPARLTLVHLWAVECKPCVDELPTLQSFFAAQQKDPRIRLLLVSETKDTAKLIGFVQARRGFFPNVELYQILDDGLRASLQNLVQPLTLLVDERGVVHQAFVGSLLSRRSELVLSLDRYLSSL